MTLRHVHKLALLLATLGWVATSGDGRAQERTLTIGVMNDQNGPYSASSGIGSNVAAQLAIEDMHGRAGPFTVHLATFDHNNKPDIGVALAKQAYERDNVSALFDIANSAVSLAIQDIARRDGKMLVFVGSALPALFEAQCSPTSAMWLYDIDEQARGMVNADPGDAKQGWYLISNDAAAGHAIVETLQKLITAAGGRLTGAAFVPVGETDYSSVLVQAQTSGAHVLGIVNAGSDVGNAVKQAHEFGIQQTMVLKTAFLGIDTARAVGLEDGHGLQTIIGYYWNRDAASRAFADRFAAGMKGQRPSQTHAGVYSAVLHYLKAVAAAGTDDGSTVMAKMKEMPVDDFFGEGARIRLDGRLMKDSFEAAIRDPGQGSDPSDVFKIVRRLRANEIIAPMNGSCAFATAASR